MNKIEAEGKKEEELYDKFMCYCKTGEETLGKSIADAETKIPQLESDIKAAIEEKKTLEGDLEAHQADRAAAKEAMAKASSIREKEGAAFLKESANTKANIDALTKGMAGGFLQTGAADVLRRLTIAKADMLDIDRQELVAFLSGTQKEGYAPASGEILGILKQMKDEMEKDLADIMAAEAEAAQNFEELMAAK